MCRVLTRRGAVGANIQVLCLPPVFGYPQTYKPEPKHQTNQQYIKKHKTPVTSILHALAQQNCGITPLRQKELDSYAPPIIHGFIAVFDQKSGRVLTLQG